MWHTSQWWRDSVRQARVEHPRDTFPPGIMADWLDDHYPHDPGAAARSRLIRAQLAGDLPDEITFRQGRSPVDSDGRALSDGVLTREWPAPAVNESRGWQFRADAFPGTVGNVSRLTVRFGLVRAIGFFPYRVRKAAVVPLMIGDPVERAVLTGLTPMPDIRGRSYWENHGPECEDGYPPDATPRRRPRRGRLTTAIPDDGPPADPGFEAVLEGMRDGRFSGNPAGALAYYYEQYPESLPAPVWKHLPPVRVSGRLPARHRGAVRNVFPSERAALKAAWAAAFLTAWAWAFPGEPAPRPAAPLRAELEEHAYSHQRVPRAV